MEKYQYLVKVDFGSNFERTIQKIAVINTDKNSDQNKYFYNQKKLNLFKFNTKSDQIEKEIVYILNNDPISFLI